MGTVSYTLGLDTDEEQTDWLLRLRWVHQGAPRRTDTETPRPLYGERRPSGGVAGVGRQGGMCGGGLVLTVKGRRCERIVTPGDLPCCVTLCVLIC